jgi:hypothetical protein
VHLIAENRQFHSQSSCECNRLCVLKKSLS